MIKLNDVALENAVKNLSFANQMRVIAKYTILLSENSEKDMAKIKILLQAYVFQYLINGNYIIDLLINNSNFIKKISSFNEQQVEEYITLASQASLGVLLTNKTLLDNYSTDDHLRICQIHIANQENPLLASAIELAAKHHAKVLYIAKIAEYIGNPNKQDEVINDLLVKEEFYTITSDFEKLIVLDNIARSESFYEKTLYKYLVTKDPFNKDNDIYYIIALVKGIMSLKNQVLGDQLIMEINNQPRITQAYPVKELIRIMHIILEFPAAKKYFFNSFVISHFSVKGINAIYALSELKSSQEIDHLLNRLHNFVEEEKDSVQILKQEYYQKHKIQKFGTSSDDQPAKEVDVMPAPRFLAYKISKDGE